MGISHPSRRRPPLGAIGTSYAKAFMDQAPNIMRAKQAAPGRAATSWKVDPIPEANATSWSLNIQSQIPQAGPRDRKDPRVDSLKQLSSP